MESTWRERTVWAVALLSVLVGSILVYLGVGTARGAGIGWLEYIREMFALVDHVSVGPGAVLGVLLVGFGTMTIAFLSCRWWSLRRDDAPDRGRRSRALTVAWWGTAALIVIGLLTVLIGVSAPQPSFSYQPTYLASPSVIEDPRMLFDTIYVSSSTFVGAGVLWAGLLAMSVLIGRAVVTGRPSTAPLSGIRRGPAIWWSGVRWSGIWWSGVALTAIGLAVLVISRVTLPPAPDYAEIMPPVASSSVYLIEGADTSGWVTASFIGTAMTVVGMLIMCVVITLSAPARQTETAATATAD